ncbi:phage tail sheath family protein [Maricaulis maris]|uniref:phage tail sheath family protein n=1 Tax=Maricaulis maris TaxID=74318 RepID=UPI003B8B5A41
MNRRKLLLSAAATAASASLLPPAGAQRRITQPTYPGVYVTELPEASVFIERPLDVAVFVGPLASGLPTGEIIAVSAGDPHPAEFDRAMPTLQPYFDQGGQHAVLVHAAADSGGVADYDAALDALDNRSDLAFTLLYLVDATGARDDASPALTALYERALSSARNGFATLIIDAPDNATDYADWRTRLGLSDPDIAAYAPWLTNSAGETVPPGPVVMGSIMAITAADGVWKAPAGLQTRISYGTTRTPTQAEMGAMTNANTNPIWTTPQNGTVLWGARTFSSSPDTRYLPVRRLQRWIEGSLPASLAWAAVRDNDAALWREVSATVVDFLNGIYRAGALMGQTPAQSYFVQCGLGETMTQADIDAGKLVVLIGVAPVRPAEFIVIEYEMRIEPN